LGSPVTTSYRENHAHQEKSEAHKI